MPWNSASYPAAMKNLPLDVRRKAIDIANALLGQGYDEGHAIAIAVTRARMWSARRHHLHGTLVR